jgi:ATP-dependent Clp protease ATP-binding subunit ClpC
MNKHFSQQLKEVLSRSREEAIRLQNDAIGTGHLVLALIKQGDNSLAPVFSQAKVSLPDLQKGIETIISREKSSAGIPVGQARIDKKRFFGVFSSPRPQGVPLSREAEKAIRASVAMASQMKSSRIELTHLFLSILKDKESFVANALSGYGLTYQVAEAKLR